jgi:hypothetical protein
MSCFSRHIIPFITIPLPRFIILRYAGILATLPSLWFTSIQSNHCQAAVIISQVGVILVVASSGIIFGYRVAAIWKGNRLVCVSVTTLYVTMVGCWVYFSNRLHFLSFTDFFILRRLQSPHNTEPRTVPQLHSAPIAEPFRLSNGRPYVTRHPWYSTPSSSLSL